MSYLNYDDVVSQLTAAGLVLDDSLRIDWHKPVRCKTTDKTGGKKGWYRLYSLSVKEGELIVGSFGIWAGADQNAQKIELPSVERKQLTPEQQAAIKARQLADKKRAEAERKTEIDKAAAQASAWWRQCADAGESKYLIKKGLPGRLYGSRISAQGNTVIPIQNADGRIFGLQVIYHDPKIKAKKGRDKDYTPTGLAKTGHYFLIGVPVAGGIALQCEGFATGASLHEATGLPVIIAFDANNLMPVATAVRKRWRGLRILFCADDDWVQACVACKKFTRVMGEYKENCEHCGQPHGKQNAGVTCATNAALAVDGAWLTPTFPVDRPTNRKTISDFNDLHVLPEGGLHLVTAQINTALEQAGWSIRQGGVSQQQGGGDVMVSRLSVDDAVIRYCGTYGFGGDVLFDWHERRLVHKKDVMNLLPRHGFDALREHPAWRVVRDEEVGFDPTELDAKIKCNLFGGWPTTPREGSCERLLELLQYLCSNEINNQDVYDWILKWLAYPLQYRGAKMHSAIVVHGPQGTGKSRFFEAYGSIYGKYSCVLGQEALEDKFNADWMGQKLFILADEILARGDVFHGKNKLKGLITGDTVRVNPKNMAAHHEKNQMNFVFLSNEHLPLVLENDDRRHGVIWSPPKLADEFFAEVDAEIANGGIEALHHFLLNIELGAFKPWTRPPMTQAKEELVELGRSSIERFMRDWLSLNLFDADGTAIPVCPCLSATLNNLYRRWCEQSGERTRKKTELIGFIKKIPGWTADKPEPTCQDLRASTTIITRRMVVPSYPDMTKALTKAQHDTSQAECMQRNDEIKRDWLTRCHFLFEDLARGGTQRAA